MDAEIKSKWVAALRSGDYVQGAGGLKQLTDGVVQHCCLGVLCEVLGTRQELPEESSVWLFGEEEETDHGYLPQSVERSTGIDGVTQRQLATKNDTGSSFAEIADYIEENL